jgi:ABC-type glycerol-3-phosphate transport system substrate-binding protein
MRGVNQRLLMAGAGVAALGLAFAPAAQGQETVTLWSHWADHQT